MDAGMVAADSSAKIAGSQTMPLQVVLLVLLVSSSSSLVHDATITTKAIIKSKSFLFMFLGFRD